MVLAGWCPAYPHVAYPDQDSSASKGADPFEQGAVALQKIQRGKVFGGHPTQGLALEAFRLAMKVSHQP